MRQLFLILLVIIFLSSCAAAEKLASVGSEPSLSTIRDPLQAPDYRQVSMPVPTAHYPAPEKNGSLWRQGAKAFFKDQRAAQVGDILTVLVDVNDKAEVNNSTERKRDNSENAGLTNLLGLESKLDGLLPGDVDPGSLVNANSDSSSKGNGKITRSEKIKMNVAATIIQQLPNGNFVILGKQQFRVNYELRELQITGIIRPHDISAKNTIEFEKIAEARVSYGGDGVISDVQQPRYGQQIFDIIYPH